MNFLKKVFGLVLMVVVAGGLGAFAVLVAMASQGISAWIASTFYSTESNVYSQDELANLWLAYTIAFIIMMAVVMAFLSVIRRVQRWQEHTATVARL